ncbi:hypothetical protein AA313_de0203736 [Arthrobotrys entomopaga]|nr:hypothetical protein AA313_de0203736 [Arthrobotrys entomopaga]
MMMRLSLLTHTLSIDRSFLYRWLGLCSFLFRFTNFNHSLSHHIALYPCLPAWFAVYSPSSASMSSRSFWLAFYSTSIFCFLLGGFVVCGLKSVVWGLGLGFFL